MCCCTCRFLSKAFGIFHGGNELIQLLQTGSDTHQEINGPKLIQPFIHDNRLHHNRVPFLGFSRRKWSIVVA